jgi:hypothetical protein
MSDLLSAASLLLAVIAVLYGLWYPELLKALDTPIAKFREDRLSDRNVVRAALAHKSRPLMVASVGMAAVFLPDTFGVLYNTWFELLSHRLAAIRQYDAVQTSFVVVEMVLLGLAVHLVRTHRRLHELLKSLKAGS